MVRRLAARQWRRIHRRVVSLSATSASVPASGGIGSFNSNAGPCWFSLAANASWITYTETQQSPSSTEFTIQYTVAANMGSARTGNIGSVSPPPRPSRSIRPAAGRRCRYRSPAVAVDRQVTLPGGTVAASIFAQTLPASNGNPPHTWSVLGGASAPRSLAQQVRCTVMGTPSQAGGIRVHSTEVTDSSGRLGFLDFRSYHRPARPSPSPTSPRCPTALWGPIIRRKSYQRHRRKRALYIPAFRRRVARRPHSSRAERSAAFPRPREPPAALRRHRDRFELSCVVNGGRPIPSLPLQAAGCRL